MGDAQSAQLEGKEDAEAHTEQNTEDKPLRNDRQITEINGKADSSLTEFNGYCEDEVAAGAILSPDEDVSESEKPVKEEEMLKRKVEINNENESPNKADANEDVPLETIEMDAKQNDINESFRRFFSNIGLKLTVKRGSGEIATDMPDKTNKEEPNRPEDVEDTAKEITSENAEQNTDVNTAQETYDNDSTTCPTLTDVTSEDVLENAEEKTTEMKKEVESDKADAATTSRVGEDATPEEEPHSTSPSSPGEEVVVSPIKRFFTTGIFSGLRKKKKPAEAETTDKELEDMREKEVIETTEQTGQDQQQDKEEISIGVEAAAVETEHKENELKREILSAAKTTDASTTDPSTIVVTEPEILSSQEKEKVQASPLKRLLSGSSLKKLSKKQRGRKSSDAKLSDSGEHDQLLSSTESAENQKQEGCVQPPAEAAGEDDGAWASFKKLVTPKKRMKRSSLSNEETQIPGSVEEPKPTEGEQISDRSTEEGKKRKDSSVSWEAVLCGSGRRRSRKTSDSEDETPIIDNDTNKQNNGSKHGAESSLENSNEVEEILGGSPSEGDGGSTWKSLKRLVTPKRKAKDEDESKDNVQSDSEVTQDESSFSIKKLLPGRKKRKSAEKQDQVSSDEADKDVASGDEDSETPAVVPLSEFDTVETEVHIQTQAEVESHIPKEADYEFQQDLLDQMTEPVLPCDSLQTEAEKVQDNDATLENQASTTPATNEEPDDLTESISKQLLSDIPEEATPASLTEEAARDDTIADDLIEITSEAITAPEPLDITLADETEMISAVSQLSSESSKTSGNTTPVPAEYVVKETDALLLQVVETISISPKAVPVTSNELRSERVVVSVSQQILETFVKEETRILERHRRSDATNISTGLNVEELEAINKLAATTQTESISEVNDSVSTEIVSELPTEEFDTAEMAVDEVHEADITHTEESLKELESIDESHHLLECLSEVNAAVSTDVLPKGDEIVPDESSLVEAHQTEPPKMDSQEADSAATVTDETKDGAMEQEVQSLTEKEDQIMDNITDQIQVEDKDQQPVEELQELAAAQDATLDSEEGSVQSLEKDVISEDIPAAETATYEIREESMLLTEVNVEPEKENELEADAAKPLSEAVQASTLDTEEASVQTLKVDVKSEDIPPAETVTDEPKETAEHLTEVSVEPENKELPANTVKTIQEPEVFKTVQAPTLDSAEDSVQSLEKEVISEDVLEAQTVTDEPKEQTIHLTEAKLEPVDASKTEHIQEAEVLQVVKAPTLDSEEGSVQSLEKEAISEDVPEAETLTDERKEEKISSIEVSFEPVDAPKTEHVQEPEVLQVVQAPTLDSEEGNVQSLEKEAISEDVPEAETLTDEPKEEKISSIEVHFEPVDALKSEHVQEPEVLPSDEKDIVTETKTDEGTSMHVHVVTESVEGGSAQELEKQILLEDVPKPNVDNVIASVTDGIESEVVAKLDNSLETGDNQKTESIPQNAGVEQEDRIPEVVDELQTLTPVCVSSVHEEASNVQVLEKTAFNEGTPPSCVDNASVTNESKHEVHLSVVQVSVEGEKESELPGTEIKTGAAEYAVVVQVVTCNLKDVSAAIPDISTEKTSAITDPLIDVTSGQVLKEEAETATPLVKDDVAETAEEGDVVVMMPVPPAECEDNHRIQVPVLNVNIKSAETIVDTVLESVVREAKEVIDTCHEMVKKVDNLSTTPKIEEELINEENKVAIQEVTQHVKENLPEAVPESVVVKLEQEGIKQPDAVTEVNEMVKRESNEVEDHKAMEDSIATFKERQDEVPTVISDVSVTEQESKDLMQIPDIPGSLDVHVQKDDLEKTEEKSDAGVTVEEVKLNQGIHEEAQITQIVQSPTVTPSNTGLVASQNTGIISSVGNVESPSSLSFEFKLNIHFGQTKAPASPPPTIEILEPVKKTDMSEVKVQAVEVVEPIKPINPTQRAESQKQTELMEVAVQATDITEPAANLDSTERDVITAQPVLLDISIQAMETAEQIKSTERASPPPATERLEPVKETEVSHIGIQAVEVVEPIKPINPTQRAESQKQMDSTESDVITAQPVLMDISIQAMETVVQIKSTERVTASVQTTETIQPEMQKRAVSLCPPVLSQACDQERKAEEPVKQKEEENDQDVWMDAEEDIDTQEKTKVSLHEVEESQEPQSESKQEKKAGLEPEVEMAPNTKTGEEESQQKMQKTAETCEIDNESEDFAVALEHPVTATASATLEWD